jgi:hypothetical protein
MKSDDLPGRGVHGNPDPVVVDIIPKSINQALLKAIS